MASNMQVTVESSRNLRQRLDRLDKDTKRKVPDLIQSAGLRIADEAKRDVPKDTGRTRNSITPRSDSGGWSVTVWADTHYAPYSEFGTGSMVSIPRGYEQFAAQFRGKGIREVNRPARPYLIPAFKKHSRRLFDDIDNLIKKLV